MELLELLQKLEVAQWIVIIFSGLFTGSLLNVFNYRIPHMLMYQNAVMVKENSEKLTKETEDVLLKYKSFNMFYPDSACPKCNHKIKWYENIPVLSYLFLKGNCSGCNTHISIEYPIIEALNCGLWICSYLIFGFTFELIFILLMCSIVLSESMIDLRHKILPDTGLFILFLIPLYLSTEVNSLGFDTKEVLLTSIFTYCSILGLVNGWEKLRGFEEDIFGRGDIKYIAAISAWVGGFGLLDIILYYCLFGLIIYLFIFLFFKKKISKLVIPLGPCISLAFILYFFDILPKITENLVIT